MKVLYYTSTAFMDISAEIIRVLKGPVELHVLIEITPGSKNENIIDVEQLPEGEVFVHPGRLLKPQDWEYLKPYFEGVASVNFIVHAHKSLLTSLTTSRQAFQYIRRINPDIFHLEALQIRAVGLLPALLGIKKMLIAVHDPLPHSGEGSWKISLLRGAFYRFPRPKGYLLYSAFARQQFDLHHPQLKGSRHVLQLVPYSYYLNYRQKQEPQRKHLLFFGRLSPYKGIDVLLEAFPAVAARFPNEKLVVAGKSFGGYELDAGLVEKNRERLTFINRYLNNQELVSLISEAKFIVCPYKDATQSGVLMTAFALNTPVIATDVGAFPEVIEEGINGLLVPVNDAQALARKMIQALEGNLFRQLEENLISSQALETGLAYNQARLLEAYSGKA